MYINQITFNKDYRCFSKGDCFTFQDITLLVGDQGCGKSTILELLSRNDTILNVDLTEIGERGVNFFYFDTEKMNPRIRDPQHYANMDGTDRGIGYGNAIASRFTSHGETLKSLTVDALQEAKNCIIFLDEPESSLSLKNQFQLCREIKKACNRLCQLIVSTHSLVLIKSMEQVLSLEHRKWMSSKCFIRKNIFPE